MNTDKLVARLRYLALILPIFALASTIYAGCSSGSSGGYYYGYGSPYGTYGTYGSPYGGD